MQDLYAAENKAAKKVSVKKKVNGQAYRVLVKPMITEKAAHLNSINQYVFMVNTSANKISVAKAIEEVYGVKPTSVNVIKMEGKKVNRGRITGKRKDFKKAIVTLKKGESISIYEGV
jgi:large subunit ribosomal protein L23